MSEELDVARPSGARGTEGGDTRFLTLGDALEDDSFPDVDLALRRGRHIDREDDLWYSFLLDAQALLEVFYRRFGCELIHPSDGYFYLLPTSDRLGKRHLSVPEMLVGQALTLLYLDPTTLERGGVVKRADALSHLAAVMGSDALTRAFNPKKKRLDERVAQETVRTRFADALRRLSALGFVDLLESEELRLRASLLRFAEPVRGRGSPAEALEQLVARGELVLGDGESEESDNSFESRQDEDSTEDPVEISLPTDVIQEFEDFGDAPPTRADPIAVEVDAAALTDGLPQPAPGQPEAEAEAEPARAAEDET